MSDQITVQYAQQYANTIELLLQQRGSKLRQYARFMPITGAKAASPVDQIGATSARRRTTRYPSIQFANTPHQRPWVFPADYDWSDAIDSIDKIRILTDPQSSYVTNGTYAMGRAMDDELIPAFFADRKQDETGSSTVQFPAGNQIAVNFGASGNTGLTVAKMREARRLLMAAEVDLDFDPLVMPITAKQHDNLLAEIQVTSLEFNERPVMVDGKVTQFLGFMLPHCERLQTDTNGYRRVPAYAKSGMLLAAWNELYTDVSVRKDLAGHPVQVYLSGTFGATRLEEGKVYEIKCAE